MPLAVSIGASIDYHNITETRATVFPPLPPSPPTVAVYKSPYWLVVKLALPFYGILIQMVECKSCKLDVMGSTPINAFCLVHGKN